MNEHDIQAVLTGDIVASQRLSATELDHVRATVEEACAEIAQWSPELMPRAVEFSRGDAWQVLLREPSMTLRAALWIRAALLFRCGVDTRVAVGIGSIAPLAESLSLSGGDAFVRSGQALDALSQARLTIVLPSSSPFCSWIDLVAKLCDAMVGSWTQRQAELVYAALSPQSLTQSAIAAALIPPVSKQAVGKGLRAAHWDAISQAIKIFEAAKWPLLGSAPQVSS